MALLDNVPSSMKTVSPVLGLTTIPAKVSFMSAVDMNLYSSVASAADLATTKVVPSSWQALTALFFICRRSQGEYDDINPNAVDVLDSSYSRGGATMAP